MMRITFWIVAACLTTSWVGRAEKKLNSNSDVLEITNELLKSSDDSLREQSSLGPFDIGQVLGKQDDGLGGDFDLQQGSGLDVDFETPDFFQSDLMNRKSLRPQSPWAGTQQSLFSSLSGTTDPYRDSVNTLEKFGEVKVESEFVPRAFDMFAEQKEDPFKMVSLWEAPETRGAREEPEQLSWGWSLKSETRQPATKKLGFWD